MNAVRVHRFGGPEVLAYEQIPEPVPGPGEVLVRVAAAGVGPWDALIRSGSSVLAQPLPLTLGADLAGTVVAIGAVGSAPCAVGDEVFGVTNARFVGAYAEFAVASSMKIAARPRGLDAVTCASIPVVAVTAMQLLNRATVHAGATVLVHGGAGNVGSYVVQMARLRHLRVIATTRSAQDADFAASLGADRTIDTSRVRFEDELETVDAVIDTVGGEFIDRSLPLLRRGGTFVSAVAAPDRSLSERYEVRAEFLLVEVTSDALRCVARLFERRAIRATVGVELPLRDARLAHEMLDRKIASPRGKIVLDLSLP